MMIDLDFWLGFGWFLELVSVDLIVGLVVVGW